MKQSIMLGAALLALVAPAIAETRPHELDRHGFDAAREGIVLMQVNWGRYRPCGKFENAQLQALSFTRMADGGEKQPTLSLQTRSRLFVDNLFSSYAYVLPAGTYALSAYDVKRAASVRDVTHHVPTAKELLPDGKPIGGTFTLAAGEIAYVGGFGLDCTDEPMPWRYYSDGRAEFEGLVAGFRRKFPAYREVPVVFRLFDTTMFGQGYTLHDPVVK